MTFKGRGRLRQPTTTGGLRRWWCIGFGAWRCTCRVRQGSFYGAKFILLVGIVSRFHGGQ